MIINDTEYVGRRVSTSSQTCYSEEKIFYPRPYQRFTNELENIESSPTSPFKLPDVKINKSNKYRKLIFNNWKNKKIEVSNKNIKKYGISAKPKILNPDFFGIQNSPYNFEEEQELVRNDNKKIINKKLNPFNTSKFKKKSKLSNSKNLILVTNKKVAKKNLCIEQEMLFENDTRNKIPKKKKDYVMHKTFYDIYEELRERSNNIKLK